MEPQARSGNLNMPMMETINELLATRLDTLRECALNPQFQANRTQLARSLERIFSYHAPNIRLSDIEPSIYTGTGHRMMEIIPSQGEYRVSYQTRQAMVNVAKAHDLKDAQISNMIDNYFIHELFHLAQKMGAGNHSGLGQRSPITLLYLDYEADALAALACASLASVFPDKFGISEKTGAWSILSECALAVLHQIDIFTLFGARRQPTMGLERFQRIAVWHFQYHRIKSYRKDLELHSIRLNRMPSLAFRNFGRNSALGDSGAISPSFPTEERALGRMDVEQLFLLAVDSDNITKLLRWSGASEDWFKNFFLGVFECKLEASHPYCHNIFSHAPWLTGAAPWYSRIGDENSPPPSPPGSSRSATSGESDRSIGGLRLSDIAASISSLDVVADASDASRPRQFSTETAVNLLEYRLYPSRNSLQEALNSVQKETEAFAISEEGQRAAKQRADVLLEEALLKPRPKKTAGAKPPTNAPFADGP